MKWTGTCYKAHDPQWAWSPLSGEGARINGGRFNPPGTPALYLAFTLEGMWCEVTQGFAHRMEPLTVCEYLVDVDGITDLRTAELCASAGINMTDLGCAWKWEQANGRKPASWGIAQNCIAAGAAGIVVPSYATGAKPHMSNLVLWKWGRDLPYKVDVFDPNDRLPKNALSWDQG